MRSAVLLLILCCGSLLAHAAEEAGYCIPIETTSDGWTVENGAEVELVDGQLLLKSGLGWIRNPHPLRDFKLHFAWKALKASDYDAGVFFRANPIAGKPFPQGFQCNLQQGKEGEIIGIAGANSAGLIRPGDWNEFDLAVVGERARLRINGKDAYDVTGLKPEIGFVGFQIEVPNGGQFLIKDIELTEIGFRPLFDGKSFAGWESGAELPPDACWTVENGLLVCTGEKGPWLRSREEYGDFNLRLDYQVAPGGNSGVYVRVPKDGNHHRANDQQAPAGFEVQILDDADPMYRTLKDYQFSASVYDFAGADPHNSKPAGAWNTLEINCRAGQVTTLHNGVMVTNLTEATVPAFALREKRGYLGLQNHSTRVAFRRLRLGPPLEYPPPNP
jgi:hypothetical protein